MTTEAMSAADILCIAFIFTSLSFHFHPGSSLSYVFSSGNLSLCICFSLSMIILLGIFLSSSLLVTYFTLSVVIHWESFSLSLLFSLFISLSLSLSLHLSLSVPPSPRISFPRLLSCSPLVKCTLCVDSPSNQVTLPLI